MPILNDIITAAADNAEERVGGPVYLDVAPWMNNLDRDGAWNGFIFRNINIPVGSIITSAYMTVRMGHNAFDEPDVTIVGLESSDPPAFTTANYDLSDRVKTLASVDWADIDFGQEDVNTSDISTIIQELFDSYGPYVDGAMGFLISSRANDSARDTAILSLAASSSYCARLHIEYSAGNSQPTIVQDTLDEVDFLTERPTLEFTGTDLDTDDLTYEIKIADNINFPTNGVNLADNDFDAGGGGFHLNGTTGVTWEGYYKVDDRFCALFQGNGGILDKIGVWLGSDSADESTDGTALVRVYEMDPATTPGTDGAPLNAAAQGSTPTPGWLAESDHNIYTYATVNPGSEKDFNFTGDDRIYLELDKWYVLSVDWRPTTGSYNNLIECDVITDPASHPGNVYIDADSANYGPWLSSGLWFKVYEDMTTLEKASDTHNGFSSGAHSDPFPSGEQIGFQPVVGDELHNGIDWFWQVRCNDPLGNNVWTDWSAIRTFTVDYTQSSTTHEEALSLSRDASLDHITQMIMNGGVTMSRDNDMAEGDILTMENDFALIRDTSIDLSQNILMGVGLVVDRTNTLDLANNVAIFGGLMLDRDLSLIAVGNYDAVAGLSLASNKALTYGGGFIFNPDLLLNRGLGLATVNIISKEEYITFDREVLFDIADDAFMYNEVQLGKAVGIYHAGASSIEQAVSFAKTLTESTIAGQELEASVALAVGLAMTLVGVSEGSDTPLPPARRIYVIPADDRIYIIDE